MVFENSDHLPLRTWCGSATFFSAQDDASDVKVRARVVFEGLVQGVFFRANTKRCADSLGLTGWVRNKLDGTVEAVFEGEEARVREAIEWCEAKQPYANVEAKTVEFSDPLDDTDGFNVR